MSKDQQEAMLPEGEKEVEEGSGLEMLADVEGVEKPEETDDDSINLEGDSVDLDDGEEKEEPEDSGIDDVTLGKLLTAGISRKDAEEMAPNVRDAFLAATENTGSGENQNKGQGTEVELDPLEELEIAEYDQEQYDDSYNEHIQKSVKATNNLTKHIQQQEERLERQNQIIESMQFTTMADQVFHDLSDEYGDVLGEGTLYTLSPEHAAARGKVADEAHKIAVQTGRSFPAVLREVAEKHYPVASNRKSKGGDGSTRKGGKRQMTNKPNSSGKSKKSGGSFMDKANAIFDR